MSQCDERYTDLESLDKFVQECLCLRSHLILGIINAYS